MTARMLRVGPWTIAFRGLEAALARALDVRWGPFVEAGSAASVEVLVGRAAPGATLAPWTRGERYRMEAVAGPGIPAVRSYGFVLAPAGGAAFALDLDPGGGEPAERRVENAARLLVARLALQAGGFALHGAAVIEDGRARVLAGPSRAGKSTAVTSLGWPVLGDDFAVLLPSGEGAWAVAATPFDNSEAIPSSAVMGTWPLRAVWRLEQGAEGALRPLMAPAAAAMLSACAAFPWALPDLAEALVAATVRCASEVECGVLTFARDTDLRALLSP
ncbi:MAG TPA: hypothetical protein VFV75_11305 [Candidatus Polarisedimenticolaceae bacterium]|nr:hypothetical protein [Candidatus Polarisedimenticolaceae bacterium]